MNKFEPKKYQPPKFEKKTDLRFDRLYHTSLTFDPIKINTLFSILERTFDSNELLEYSLNNQISLNCYNENNENLIYYILEHINNKNITDNLKMKMINFLIANNVNPDAPNKFNITPAQIACSMQSDIILKGLLDAKINVNYCDDYGNTIYHYYTKGKKEPYTIVNKFFYSKEKLDPDFDNDIAKLKKLLFELFMEIADSSNIPFITFIEKSINYILYNDELFSNNLKDLYNKLTSYSHSLAQEQKNILVVQYLIHQGNNIKSKLKASFNTELPTEISIHPIGENSWSPVPHDKYAIIKELDINTTVKLILKKTLDMVYGITITNIDNIVNLDKLKNEKLTAETTPGTRNHEFKRFIHDSYTNNKIRYINAMDNASCIIDYKEMHFIGSGRHIKLLSDNIKEILVNKYLLYLNLLSPNDSELYTLNKNKILFDLIQDIFNINFNDSNINFFSSNNVIWDDIYNFNNINFFNQDYSLQELIFRNYYNHYLYHLYINNTTGENKNVLKSLSIITFKTLPYGHEITKGSSKELLDIHKFHKKYENIYANLSDLSISNFIKFTISIYNHFIYTKNYVDTWASVGGINHTMLQTLITTDNKYDTINNIITTKISNYPIIYLSYYRYLVNYISLLQFDKIPKYNKKIDIKLTELCYHIIRISGLIDIYCFNILDHLKTPIANGGAELPIAQYYEIFKLNRYIEFYDTPNYTYSKFISDYNHIWDIINRNIVGFQNWLGFGNISLMSTEYLLGLLNTSSLCENHNITEYTKLVKLLNDLQHLIHTSKPLLPPAQSKSRIRPPLHRQTIINIRNLANHFKDLRPPVNFDPAAGPVLDRRYCPRKDNVTSEYKLENLHPQGMNTLYLFHQFNINSSNRYNYKINNGEDDINHNLFNIIEHYYNLYDIVRLDIDVNNFINMVLIYLSHHFNDIEYTVDITLPLYFLYINQNNNTYRNSNIFNHIDFQSNFDIEKQRIRDILNTETTQDLYLIYELINDLTISNPPLVTDEIISLLYIIQVLIHGLQYRFLGFNTTPINNPAYDIILPRYYTIMNTYYTENTDQLHKQVLSRVDDATLQPKEKYFISIYYIFNSSCNFLKNTFIINRKLLLLEFTTRGFIDVWMTDTTLTHLPPYDPNDHIESYYNKYTNILKILYRGFILDFIYLVYFGITSSELLYNSVNIRNECSNTINWFFNKWLTIFKNKVYNDINNLSSWVFNMWCDLNGLLKGENHLNVDLPMNILLLTKITRTRKSKLIPIENNIMDMLKINLLMYYDIHEVPEKSTFGYFIVIYTAIHKTMFLELYNENINFNNISEKFNNILQIGKSYYPDNIYNSWMSIITLIFNLFIDSSINIDSDTEYYLTKLIKYKTQSFVNNDLIIALYKYYEMFSDVLDYYILTYIVDILNANRFSNNVHKATIPLNNPYILLSELFTEAISSRFLNISYDLDKFNTLMQLDVYYTICYTTDMLKNASYPLLQIIDLITHQYLISFILGLTYSGIFYPMLFDPNLRYYDLLYDDNVNNFYINDKNNLLPLNYLYTNVDNLPNYAFEFYVLQNNVGIFPTLNTLLISLYYKIQLYISIIQDFTNELFNIINEIINDNTVNIVLIFSHISISIIQYSILLNTVIQQYNKISKDTKNISTFDYVEKLFTILHYIIISIYLQDFFDKTTSNIDKNIILKNFLLPCEKYKNVKENCTIISKKNIDIHNCLYLYMEIDKTTSVLLNNLYQVFKHTKYPIIIFQQNDNTLIPKTDWIPVSLSISSSLSNISDDLNLIYRIGFFTILQDVLNNINLNASNLNSKGNQIIELIEKLKPLETTFINEKIKWLIQYVYLGNLLKQIVSQSMDIRVTRIIHNYIKVQLEKDLNMTIEDLDIIKNKFTDNYIDLYQNININLDTRDMLLNSDLTISEFKKLNLIDIRKPDIKDDSKLSIIIYPYNINSTDQQLTLYQYTYNLNIVPLLLHSNLSPYIKNKEGLTFFDNITRMFNYTLICEYIKMFYSISTTDFTNLISRGKDLITNTGKIKLYYAIQQLYNCISYDKINNPNYKDINLNNIFRLQYTKVLTTIEEKISSTYNNIISKYIEYSYVILIYGIYHYFSLLLLNLNENFTVKDILDISNLTNLNIDNFENHYVFNKFSKTNAKISHVTVKIIDNIILKINLELKKVDVDLENISNLEEDINKTYKIQNQTIINNLLDKKSIIYRKNDSLIKELEEYMNYKTTIPNYPYIYKKYQDITQYYIYNKNDNLYRDECCIWESIITLYDLDTNNPNLILLSLTKICYDILSKLYNNELKDSDKTTLLLINKVFSHVENICNSFYSHDTDNNEQKKLSQFIEQLFIYLTQLIVGVNIEMLLRNMLLKFYQIKNIDINTSIDIVETILNLHVITNKGKLSALTYLYQISCPNFVKSVFTVTLSESINIDNILTDFLDILLLIPEFIDEIEFTEIKKYLIEYFDTFIKDLIKSWRITIDIVLTYFINIARSLKTILLCY